MAPHKGVGKAYYAYRAEQAGDNAILLEVCIEVAALLSVDGVLQEIDETATKFVQNHLAKFGVEIKNTTGATRDAYRRVQEQTVAPEVLTINLRLNRVRGCGVRPCDHCLFLPEEAFELGG